MQHEVSQQYRVEQRTRKGEWFVVRCPSPNTKEDALLMAANMRSEGRIVRVVKVVEIILPESEVAK